MAGRNYRSNRFYNNHVFPVRLDGSATIGATGAVTLVTSVAVPGSSPAARQMNSMGIKSITRLAVGTYQIQLDDNFSALFGFNVYFRAPVTGSDIPVDATTVGLSVGTMYEITAVGTATTAANWVTLGLPAGLTATVGQVFKAATTGTGTQSGAGTVKALSGNNIAAVQSIGSPTQMLNSQPFVQGNGGGYITFQTVAPSFAGTALATHTHDLKIIAGQAAAGTDAVSVKGTAPIILGKESATDKTVSGAASAASGGVVAVTAGTPAGTMSMVATDPSDGSTMYFNILLSNSALS